MTKEIYISSTPHETRLAVVEDDQLAEIYYERENEYTLAGSVYKGKVTRVLPGMQSAFVDIGLERDAFLYVTDFAEEQEDGEEYVPLSQGKLQGQNNQPPKQSQNNRTGQQQPSASRSRRAEQSSEPSSQPEQRAAQPPQESSSDAEAGEDGGARRWRGRRGRRRGRGNNPQTRPAGTQGNESNDQVGPSDPHPQAIEFELGEIGDPGIEPEYLIEPAAPAPQSARPEHSPAPSSHREPAPAQSSHAEAFVLPGESLSKYRRGQAPAETPQPGAHATSSTPTPVAAAPTFQPSTMVTAPLTWDGGDVLPGESLSRRKNKPAPQQTSSVAAEVAAPEAVAAPAAEFEPLEKIAAPESVHTLHEHAIIEHPLVAHPIGPVEVDAHASELPVEVHGGSKPEPANYEPEEASASYRIDPAAPSAYRQSSVAESAIEELPVTEITSSPEMFTPSELEISSDAEGRREEVVEEAVAEPAAKPEPFFGESVSIAQPVHDHEAPHEQETFAPAEESASLPNEFLSETEEDDQEVSEEFSPGQDHDSRTFNPGDGNLEEEMIDEEEPESYAAQAPEDEEGYDDLVEETLDMQMDSGLLSDVIRDQHIDKRTRFVEEPVEGFPHEDDPFDEDESAFDEEQSGIELEEVSDEESEDADVSNADASHPRTNNQRGNRRGVRGNQRQGQGGNRGGRMRRSTAQTSNLPAITELLKPNQEILVQIAKEPIARKGARITSHIALPGRFLVFMPTVNHVGVSRKIASDEERQRLKHILLSEKGTASGGFIVRTAAASASEEDLRADIRFLLTLWAEIKQRADNAKPPALIYHDLSLVERVLRDQVTDNFSAIWVDSEQDYERVLRFLNRFEPSLVRRVKLYTKETPLFEQFGIQEEINKALRSKVWLKSGGSIVINQTEALVAIDINTGKYVGKTARLEDTILKTNLDAIPEIVRQIRLRDLGGIIVIDFIDMDERKNRNKVMQVLEDALKSDRAPSKVLQFNDFGLVAITRKRVKQSLERTLSVPCSICTGTGMVKGPLTVCNEIYIELRKMHRQFDRGDVMLRVNPEVVKQLKATNGRWLSEMEEMSGKTIIVKSDATLHPEQFDIH
jgi:ribonuclease E